MRKSLMTFVTLAGAAVFATVVQAGDASTGKSEVAAEGGCGFGQAYLQAQADDAQAAERAETRAKIEALIDEALGSNETAAVPDKMLTPRSGG